MLRRLWATSPGSRIWGNSPPVPVALTHSPEPAPTSSRTATQSRLGVAPPAGAQATSVQISAAPAAVLKGAAGTAAQVAAAPPVRVNSPALVAATNVVGGASAGLAARRKMPRPARLVPSTLQTCANSAAVDGP